MTLALAIRRFFAQSIRFWSGPTSLGFLSLKEVLIAVALLGFVRGTVDLAIYIKTPSIITWIATCLLWCFYILSLSLSTAFLLSRFIPQSDFRQVLTMAVCLYWLIPLVPLFSLPPWELDWNLGLFAFTPYFRWIPTFTVARSYLPLGMLVVFPVILLMASRFMVRTTGTPWWRASVLTLAAYVLIYVYYYQWTWRAVVIARFDKGLPPWEGLMAGFVAYSFLDHLITFLLSPVVARSFGVYPIWKCVLWAGVPLLILFVIPRVGIYSVFLGGGLP